LWPCNHQPVSRGSGGRPRHTTEQRPGATGREQILDAAAELFTRHGFAGTSTRMIAVAVGVKQASLYYHFASKDDILAGLLSEAVRPSLDFARALARSGRPAHEQLYALTCFDVRTLVEDTWNLGVLQHLPELKVEKFAEFRTEREALRQAYGRQISRGARERTFTLPTSSAAAATALVLAFVESISAMRSDGVLPQRDDLCHVIARGTLQLLACPTDLLDAAKSASAALIQEFYPH
jgi:AcrR family transcriptional regulator